MNNDSLERAAITLLQADHRGIDNAISNGELSKRLELGDIGSGGRPGVSGSRSLSRALRKARLDGHPIGYTPKHKGFKGGVFYANTADELNHIINDFQHRAVLYFAQTRELQNAQLELLS